MKSRFKILVVLFILIVSSVQIFSQETFNLSYKFEKGKTYFYRSVSDMDMNINAMGQEINTKSESKTKMRMEVADVTADKFEIINSVDSLYSKTGNPMGEDVINNGENIVGKKTKMIFNNLGKKLKTIEIDPIISAEGMNSSGAASLLLEITGKPVKAGDVWNIANTDTNKSGEAGSMITKSDIEYKVEGKENKNSVECVKLSFKGTLKIEGSMNQQGMDMVLEGTGKISGLIYFDTNKGLINSIDNLTDMNITIAIPAQNMTMPMIQKMKSTTILTDK